MTTKKTTPRNPAPTTPRDMDSEPNTMEYTWW